MLHLDNLTKRYGDHVLWQNLTRDIPSGTMTAIVGPSGSGKSTLLNCIGLLDRPDEGTITLDDRPLSGLGQRRRRLYRRNTLGYLFQNYALIPDATVRENVVVAIPGQRTPERSQRIAEALEQVGLSGREAEPTHHFSGGEQQRLALARLIAKRPALILADEPTGALDHGNAAVVIRTLRTLADDGATVLIATHNDDVRDACDERIDLG